MKKVLNVGLLVLLILVIATSVLLFGGILPEYAIPFYILAALLLAVWSLKWLFCRHVSWVWSPLHIPVLLFLIYTIVQYFNSSIEHDSRIDLFHLGLYTCVYLLVACNLHRPYDRFAILTALAALAVAEAAYGFWQYWTVTDRVLWLDRGLDYHGRGSGTYFCPNHLAGFLEMVLLLLGGWYIAYRQPAGSLPVRLLRSFLVLASLAVIALGLFSTSSRGGWIAAIMSIPILLILAEVTRAASSRFLIGIFVTFALTTVAFASLPSVRGRVGQALDFDIHYRFGEQPLEIKEGFAGRTAIWQGTLGLIHDYAFFGTGPGTWQWFQLRYRVPGSQIRPQYAHNDVLQLVAEYGLIGFSMILALFALFYWQAGHLIRHGESAGQRALCLGAMGAVTVILLHSLVDFNLHIPANALVVATLMGLVAAQGHVGDHEWRTQVPRTAKLILGIIVLAIALGGLTVGLSLAVSQQYANRAYDAAQLYNWDEALQLYQHALHDDPRSPEIYEAIGDLYRTQSSLMTNEDSEADRQSTAQTALVQYQKALLLNPYDSPVILKMADASELAGDNAAALRWYQRVMEIDPNNAFNWVRLGIYYSHMGDTNQAIQTWEQAKRLNPGDWTAENLLHEIDPHRP